MRGAESIGHDDVSSCGESGAVDLIAILDIELLNGSQLTGWGIEVSDNLECHRWSSRKLLHQGQPCHRHHRWLTTA